MIGLTVRLEETLVEGRRGRPVSRWRAACACGFVTEWRATKRWASERAEAHVAEFCPSPGPVRVAEHLEPGTAEWQAVRAARLGGSEVAAVVGLSPWESQFSLWHRKAGLYVEDRDNEEMRAGREFEPVIAGAFARRHPDWSVERNVGAWVHRERPWQLSNPDGLVYVDGGRLALLEVKFALHDWQWGEAGSEDVPVYYRCQAQWYLDVWGLQECWFAVFFGGTARHREYVVRADPEDQAMLRKAAAGFLADVAAGVRPPIDGHDATYQVVKALHPSIDPVGVPVPDDLAQAYCTARHALAAAEVEAKRQTARIAEHMGNAQYATWAGRRIARRQAKGGGTPYVVAERDLPFSDEEMREAS